MIIVAAFFPSGVYAVKTYKCIDEVGKTKFQISPCENEELRKRLENMTPHQRRFEMLRLEEERFNKEQEKRAVERAEAKKKSQEIPKKRRREKAAERERVTESPRELYERMVQKIRRQQRRNV